ncbi:MAG: hypothetical protein GXN98_01535 [Euryarchaeota archaeon]|nr:hypothetical protein [Euryarchaeota archaeon]
MSISLLREIAEELEESGYTVEVVHRGKVVLRAGRDARGSLLGRVMPVEVRDPGALLKLLL